MGEEKVGEATVINIEDARRLIEENRKNAIDVATSEIKGILEKYGLSISFIEVKRNGEVVSRYWELS